MAPTSSSHAADSAGCVKQQFDDVIKSEQDKRHYRGLILNNGLKVLLVSDPETDKSAAALDVHIGSMKDPEMLPGLAHFCEHMLFMGTEKYPVENEYAKFLSEHGGSCNAYTSGEHTNFYFDVAPDQLPQILDRFAQFFLHPLFDESTRSREVKAVNSENDKNLQNDFWRLNQLDKSLSLPGHDYCKFGTGNIHTLEARPAELGVNVREELLRFHEQHYSSNIMSLSVLGKESLDELSDLVTSLFHAVMDKQVEVPEWPQHPYGEDQLRMKAYVVPVKDLRALHVTWPTEDLSQYWESNPGHYLGHLIGHEGPGSLLSELKARGWVNTLVGGEKHGARGFSFFMVNVDLTEEGIEHVDDIIQLVFQYVNMLRQCGPQQWVFDECKNLSHMTFRFKDKEKPQGYVTALASTLHEPYPVNEVLSGPYLLKEFRPDIVTSAILNHLTPDKVRVAVIGKKFEAQCKEVEPWYKTQYMTERIDENILKRWRECGTNDKLHLPVPNEFIPTNFDLVDREPAKEGDKLPTLIHDNEMARLWYKQDDKFLLPKAFVHLEIISPIAYQDPSHVVMLQLFDRLFSDALTEYAYAAELAGLSYNLTSTRYGIELLVKGYNDKLRVLLRKILEKMSGFEVDEKRFEIMKEVYMRGLRNFKAEQPHQQAIYYTTVLMSERFWTKDELLDAAQDITASKLQEFLPQLFSRLYIEALFYGNITKQEAQQMYEQEVGGVLMKQCQSRPALAEQLLRHRELQLPDGCHYVYEEHNEVHPAHCIEVCYQCSMQETHSNVLLELFSQIIAEPCFDMLRTKEQLGYLVHSGLRRSNGTQGLRVIVQSHVEPRQLDQRIEAFLLNMETCLKEMSDEEFNKHVASLATRRLEKPKKMSHQSLRYWSEIVSQQYNFDRDEVEVGELRRLTQPDVISFYHDLISFNSPRRHKLSVQVVSTLLSAAAPDVAPGVAPAGGDVDGTAPTVGVVGESGGEQAEPPPPPPPTHYQAQSVDNLMEFKKSLALFPLPKPYMDLPPAGTVRKHNAGDTEKSKL